MEFERWGTMYDSEIGQLNEVNTVERGIQYVIWVNRFKIIIPVFRGLSYADGRKVVAQKPPVPSDRAGARCSVVEPIFIRAR